MSDESYIVNEELLDGCEPFDTEEARAELRQFFKFDERRILFGHGALQALPDECERLGARRVYLVRDPALDDLSQHVEGELADAQIGVVAIDTAVVANPTVEGVDALAARLSSAPSFDVVVALGGGSTMDSCKVAVTLAANGGSASDYFGFDQFEKAASWPLICLPTTAGTGAEASRVSVVATDQGKQAIYDDHILPGTAIVDPELTMNMPHVLTATTGLDAIGHALECTASKKSNALADAVARASLQAGLPYFERAVTDGALDAAARRQMSRCSILAGLLLGPINTGAAHALGYSIEKLSFLRGHPVPHGTAVALVLPGVMLHNAPVAAEKYYYAAGVAGIDLGGASQEEGVGRIVAWIDDLRRRHTPYGCLGDAGLTSADIPEMIQISLQIRRLLDPNPVEVTEADAERIYRGVL
ncbi:MAG: iron-containing alcohol dehydrogenase [Gemmatimonadetes bacterium]|nr:iron-containing alcohol dehydrogenase [Gemmatimonadota bacterium]MBT6144454.1 iron-containing alcohol dehydrogenase [Gemmatimonadota bacterium]MBT7863970.1 iron-containing alcohol dehydrogenase [Gemmatimonadota bacterium]